MARNASRFPHRPTRWWSCRCSSCRPIPPSFSNRAAWSASCDDMDRPMQITRHWRLGSLSAWLTLQLRYIVFHGPAKRHVNKLALRQIDARAQ
ncbi:MAG: hypothetical protein MZV70_01815 [Desulfobacterales bacterium]|nr:hypothetical protein [Desulfobacterales bacterium]